MVFVVAKTAVMLCWTAILCFTFK